MNITLQQLSLVALVLSASLFVEAANKGPEKENASPVPPPDKILATLRASHPRIMVDAKTFDVLKASVDKGGLPARIYASVKKSADKTLTAPVSIYEKPDGKRLLSVSRRVLERVSELALVSRLEKDSRYADRAWKELEAAAAFPDWNPSHFLDTAEMTHAFALGYDWLYDQWTVDQRRVLQKAILEKGLNPGLKVYASKKGWHTNENNWNQVCNGGLISGALAIADIEPKVAGRIVCEAIKSVPLAMRHYEPDGAGSEGVTYWSYAARYNVALLESLQTALGTDFGLSKVGAFGLSGYYQIYMSGAGRTSFDFADCGRSSVSTPQHFWLARHYDVPAFSWFRLSMLESSQKEGGLWDLLWLDMCGKDMDVKTLPLDKHFRGSECAVLRTSWEPNALIVGIQAGDSMNLGGHRHLDLGSFIVDALGERWITDSGTEHETYMAHQHKNPRYAYYRVRAEGHNLPVLNPSKEPDQNPKAIAKFTRFVSEPKQALATVDLSEAYQPHASRVLRTFTLPERKRLVVTDEISATKPSELWWFLHTEAKVALNDDKRTATLSQNGKSFIVRLEEPKDAVFSVMECKPLPSSPNPEKQASNGKRQKLAVHLNGVDATRVQVAMEPVSAP
jgi:hypothetical protein